MPAAERLLIVNADDLGLSEGVNRGIVEAHQRGIVTSASLMVLAPAAADAAAMARAQPRLGVGLHLDIGEWLLRDGEWIARYERVAEGDAAAAGAEVRAQIALFEELIGRPPDHLDSHQHVHLSRPEVAEAVDRAAAGLGIGVRGRGSRVRYRSLYGQDENGRPLLDAIQAAAYVAFIGDLEPGVTELCCHPGHAGGLESDYATERETELRSLCDPAVRAAVAEGSVRLITWAEAR